MNLNSGIAGVKLKTVILLLTMSVLVLSPAVPLAATWTVEKDGSGDFMIIQDALDAAAPGDSILVGPGRYDTFRPAASVIDGFQFAAIAWVTTPGLTIVGAGWNTTTIGPEIPTTEEFGVTGFCSYVEASGTVIREFGFQNTPSMAVLRAQSILEDCRLSREPLLDFFAVTIAGADGVVVRRNEIIGVDGLITGPGVTNLLVEDCFFDDDTMNGIAVGIGNGAQDCMVRRCTIRRGASGVQFSFGGSGWVEDCTIENTSANGIDFSGSWAIVRRCRIGQTRRALRASLGRLEVYDTILEGGTFETIGSTTDVLVRNSHILNVGGSSVRGRASGADELIDLRNNWWGTADSVLVESWIDDLYGNVLWQPMSGVPLPTGTSSIGGLKSRFHSEGTARN